MADKIVIVFDFDKTIIDIDSDNWVVDELGATDLFNQLLPTMPWNSLMDLMMKELHSQGRSIGDIADVLKRVPIHPDIVPAIKSAHKLGCELRIVSDANLFYIETVLNQYGIRECFSEIHTNSGYVDEQGRLRIFPCHDMNSPHRNCCGLCPPNMCKGMIIETIIDSKTMDGKKLIYLGDGVGDYCPSLKLREGDYVMPRKNFPVWELICKTPMLIKAKIHEWSDGEELARIMLKIIDIEENGTELVGSTDCKLQTMAISAQEAFPRPLPVPY